ncbi:hypothetical protein AJ88_43860 [Mesorhizobium amorphae CCBAU 01583]|nr:hypothetical protein AJ88_43860 [Mesorhizobium amorphae CCBAU 01583]
MALADIVLQRGIIHALACLTLDPFHTARGEVRRRPKARLLLQHVIGDFRAFEGDEKLPAIVPAADRKDLAADLPDMGAAPLDDMGRLRQRGAEPL